MSRLPPWVETYVGLPFASRGRDRRGLDCWGLVRLAMAEQLGIELPIYLTYADAEDRKDAATTIEAALARDWQPVEEGKESLGDVAVFRVAGAPMHVGLVLDRERMLHIHAGIGACVERWRGALWEKRIFGVFRPRHVQTRVAALPTAMASKVVAVPEGATLAEMVDILVPGALRMPDMITVQLGADTVPPAMWPRIKPKIASRVVIRVSPAGGGGGKNLFRVVAAIAIVVASVATGQLYGTAVGTALLGEVAVATAVGTALITTTLTAVGFMALNALVPLPVPELGGLSGGRAPSRFYSTGAARNTISPFGAIPVILGRHRVAPPYGALPFTTLKGQDRYITMLFIWGYGPLRISEVYIGRTLFTSDMINVAPSFDSTTTVIEHREGWETDAPITIFPNEVIEDAVDTTLSFEAGWVTRTTATDVTGLEVEIAFPRGLTRFDDDGSREARRVSVEAEYAPTGTEAWISLGTKEYSSKKPDPLRFLQASKLDLEKGTYDVRVRRTTEEANRVNVIEEVQWSLLRNFRNEPPIAFDRPLCMTAITIKESEQLAGLIDTLTGIAHSILPDYDETTQSWVTRPTNNPASLYRAVLQGPANPRPLLDGYVDLPSIEAFHQHCTLEGFTFDFVLDRQMGVWQLCQTILASGRGARTLTDGKRGVMVDRWDKTSVQMVTPANSWGWNSNRSFRKKLDAIRVRFVDADNNYDAGAEFFVYNDGKDRSNATLIESMEFPGVTNTRNLWKLGRYFIGQLELRPETFTWFMDLEHMAMGRGDLVTVVIPELTFGVAAARIAEVHRNLQGEVTGVRLDTDLDLPATGTLQLRIRMTEDPDIRQIDVSIRADTQRGPRSDLMFETVSTEPIAEGDLCALGVETTTYRQLVVKGIKPGSDLTAQITAVDYAPELALADTGEIPDRLPFGGGEDRAPATPWIVSVTSGYETQVNTSTGPVATMRILVLPQSGVVQAPRLELVIDLVGEAGAPNRFNLPFDGSSFVYPEPVLPEATYSVMARAISPRGVPSAWASVIHETSLANLPPPNITAFEVVETPQFKARVFTWALPFLPPDIDFYEIRFGAEDSAWETMQILDDYKPTDSPYQSDRPSQPGTYKFGIVAQDRTGQRSAAPYFITRRLEFTAVQNAQPGVIPRVTGLFVEETAEHLRRVHWDLLPFAWVDGYELVGITGNRKTWNAGVPLHSGMLRTSPYEVRNLPPFTTAIGIRVVAIDGTRGPETFYDVSLEERPLENILQRTDLAPDWNGNVIIGAVSGGTLRALGDDYPMWLGVNFSEPVDLLLVDSSNRLILTDDGEAIVATVKTSDNMWSLDPDQPMWRGRYLGLEYEQTVAVLSGGGIMTLELVMEGPVRVFYRHPDPLGVLPSWVRYTSPVIIPPGVGTVQLRFYSDPLLPDYAEISLASLVLDTPDLVERFDNFSVFSDGTTKLEPITKPFTNIVSALINHADLESAGKILSIIKLNDPDGPIIQARDPTTGALTGATVNVTLRGF